MPDNALFEAFWNTPLHTPVQSVTRRYYNPFIINFCTELLLLVVNLPMQKVWQWTYHLTQITCKHDHRLKLFSSLSTVVTLTIAIIYNMLRCAPYQGLFLSYYKELKKVNLNSWVKMYAIIIIMAKNNVTSSDC